MSTLLDSLYSSRYCLISIILLLINVGTDGEELSKIQKVKLIRNEQREGMLKFTTKKN